MLYYGYRVPPMYDERLSQMVIKWLQVAPLFMLIFGFWMASSQQLLSNKHLSPVADTEAVYDSNHMMFIAFDHKGWMGFLWTMLLSLIFMCVIKCCGRPIGKKIEDKFESLKIGDVELDEDISNFWSALDEEDRKWSQREEQNARNALGMPMLTQIQNQNLMQSQMTEGKTLQGVHSYDILANPLYLDDFQYVTAAEDDRNEMIIDDDDDEDNDAAQSDFVRVALNLAYLTEDEARNFKFDKNCMTKLKKAKTGTGMA